MFCFLSSLNIKVKGLNNFFSDYMNIDNTNCIKGIFVWIIVFCHKTKYGIYKNHLFFKIVSNLGQKVVSMFLFYSGFGIYESLQKKGITYIKSLSNKAIILFIKFQLILLMFLLTNIFIFNNNITFKKYFFCIIFKSSLGNSKWFAFTIIILYIYTFLSFRFIKSKHFIGIIIISILCFFHIILVYKYFYPKAMYAVDTVFCFVIGFYYSLFKKYLDKVIFKSDICYFAITSIIILIFYEIYNINNLVYSSIKNAIFSLLVVLISVKVKFNNDFLKF